MLCEPHGKVNDESNSEKILKIGQLLICQGMNEWISSGTFFMADGVLRSSAVVVCCSCATCHRIPSYRRHWL